MHEGERKGPGKLSQHRSARDIKYKEDLALLNRDYKADLALLNAEDVTQSPELPKTSAASLKERPEKLDSEIIPNKSAEASGRIKSTLLKSISCATSALVGMGTHYVRSENLKETGQFGVQVFTALMVISFLERFSFASSCNTKNADSPGCFLIVKKSLIIAGIANVLMFVERGYLVPPTQEHQENLWRAFLFMAYLSIDLI